MWEQAPSFQSLRSFEVHSDVVERSTAGVSGAAEQYSINAGGPAIPSLRWTASSSTPGVLVRTPTGEVFKYEYLDVSLTGTPEGEKYDP